MSDWVKWGLVWLGVATVFAWGQIFHLRNQPRLVLWPGGQDEMFFQTASGERVLVNGGEGKKILQCLDEVMPWGEKSLNLLILTSWRQDYLEGLISVLQNYQVENVLWLGAEGKKPVFQEWVKILERKKVHQIIAQSGQKVSLGSWVIEVLSPSEAFYRYQTQSESNVVWKLKTDQQSFLFLGRASAEEIAALKDSELKAQIVEVNENQKDLPLLFWQRIRPSLVLVSGGWPEEKVFPFSLRQTQREGRIVINF